MNKRQNTGGSLIVGVQMSTLFRILDGLFKRILEAGNIHAVDICIKAGEQAPDQPGFRIDICDML